MKILLSIILFLGFSIVASAQNEILATQYIHNRYAVNSAFAGAREGVSLFGSYRKQWLDIPGSPASQLFTAHAPLRNNNIALGMSAFYQKFAIASNSGISLTYAYRFRTGDNNWFSLAVSPGVSFMSSTWEDLKTIEPGDEAFINTETLTTPMLGFGAAWYGQRFFAGFSIPTLFYNNQFNDGDGYKFSPADATYIVTGGYLISLDEMWSLQPAMLVRYNKEFDEVIDVDATLIYDNFLMLGLSYRTTKEASVTAAIQIDRRLRAAYSYDYGFGDFGKYHSGSHEISLQYDFVYRSKSVSPKFY